MNLFPSMANTTLPLPLWPTQHFHASIFLLYSEQFIPQLTRIDECLEFLQKHTRYKDAHTYTTRFQQLQSKALGLVRAHITNTLKTATQNVMTQTQVCCQEAGTDRSL